MSRFKELVVRVVHLSVPGVVVGVMVGLGGLVGSGVKQAAYDLYKHAVFIHPFLISLAFFGVASSVAIQGADVSEKLEKLFLLPLLSFMTHLFSVGVGALLPLHLSVVGASGSCENVGGLIGTWLVLVLLAVVSVATLMVVEERSLARKDAKAVPQVRASPNQLLVFVVYACVAFGAMLFTGSLGGTTSELIAGAQVEAGSMTCSVATWVSR